MTLRTRAVAAAQLAVFTACLCAAVAATAAPPRYRLKILSEKAWENVEPVAINNAGHVLGTFEPVGTGRNTFLYRDGTVTDIRPASEFFVLGTAINDAGVVVGTTESMSGFTSFRYEDGVFTKLAIPELTRPSATDINESGQIVGWGRDPESGNSRTFLYQDGAVDYLPDGPFDRGIEAVAINDSGTVVGKGSRDNAAWAFIYQDGETTDMGALGRRSAAAHAINNAGRVTGAVDAGYGGFEMAFVRTPAGKMTQLGTLGGTSSFGFDINGAGHVVGQSTTRSGFERAFLYKSGVMRNLGSLGSATSHARDITDNGQVVGVVTDDYTLETSRVFIYGVDGSRTRDLNDLIAPADPLKPYVHLRWVPFRGAVNEYGQVAALGLDSRSNRMRAFLVSPIDSTPPVVEATLTGTVGSNGWHTSDVDVAWVITDAEAPVAARIGCATEAVTADSPGVERSCQAKSIGGTSAVRSVTVKRDATKPAIGVPRPANGAIYNRNQVVYASYRCTDATSGIRSCTGPIPSGERIDTSQPVTNATFRVVAIDNAGLKRVVTRTYSVN